jgi:hypothetical protein
MGYKCSRCNGLGREEFVKACPNPECDGTNIDTGFERTWIWGWGSLAADVGILWLGISVGGTALLVCVVIAVVDAYFAYGNVKYGHGCRDCGAQW